jgi:hypothetical protein
MTHFTKNAEPGYIVRSLVKHRTLQTFKVNSSTSSIMAAAVKLEYLVEWDGYEGQEEYIWEPHCTLAQDVPILVQEYRRKHNLNLTSTEPRLLPFPPNPGSCEVMVQDFEHIFHDRGRNQMSCSAVPETPRIGKTGGEDSTLWRLDDVVSGEMSSELDVGKKRCAADAGDSFCKKVVAAGPKVDKAKAAAQGPRGEAGGEKLEIKRKEAKNKQDGFQGTFFACAGAKTTTMVPGYLIDGTAVGFVWPPKHHASHF